MSNDIIQFAVFVAVAFGALALSVLAIHAINAARGKASPSVDVILSALQPFAVEALFGAAQMAEKALKTGESALEGADKKAIAVQFYALLPERIEVAGHDVPIGVIKALIPVERWQELVQSVFDSADARLKQNEQWLAKQVSALKPPTPGAG